MQIAEWLWNWLDAKQPAGCIVPPFDYTTKLSSLRLEDRRVLSVTPVLTGGVLDVSLTAGGDTAKISVVQDNQGVSSILVTDQLNNTTKFLASAVDSIEITGAAGAQSVVFEGSNLLDIGSLSINNSIDHVTIQSAVNVHSGPATILASQDIQIEGTGALTADDPNSSADALNITLSSGEDLTVQQLFASGKINLSAASSLTITDGAATHDLQAGTGISASVTGNLGSFVIESSADVNSLSGGVSVTANRMDLAGTITAQGQSVFLAPNPVPLQLPPAVTTGRLIDLGTTLDGPDFLGLSASELSHIDAATLAIGNNQSGAIAITAAITFPNEIDLSLRTGNNQISFQGGSLDLQGGDLTLRTGNGGAVIADAAGLDVSADTVSIFTGLGIGTSVNPLRMNASFLTTNTSAANAGQFLSEVDAVTIASAGLNAGTGTINLVDGLFVSGGTDRIRDISSLVVGLDATFNLQGHAETLANLTNNGSLILGPALVDSAALSMTGDATFNVVINGLVPGISYSQLESSGPVTLGQATLNLSLGTSLIVGAQFTLLDNTGSAPIVGTFKNLAEGATFHDAATTFSISYVGGASGNDIVLTVIATPTNVFVDGMGNLVVADSIVGGNRDQLTIQSDVANAQYIIHDPVNLFITNIPGATISPDLHTIKVPFSAIPGTQVLVNTYGQDDSLTVDFSLGDFSRSVRYDGGTMSSTGDAFALIGGPRFSAVEHRLVDTVSGEVSVRGSKLMTYQSVEDSVSDRLNAQNRTFSFAGGSANVALQASGNFLKITSNQSASVTFVNPTSLLAINGSVGDDNITVFSVNPGFRASMTIDGGAGTDVVNLRTALVLGSATSAGDLNVTAETINLSADIRTNNGPTGGDVTLTGTTAIILESNITINTDVATGSDGQITFNSPVKGDQVPAARDLTLTAGSGTISMQNIGIGKALRKFTVTSAGQTSLQQVQTLAGGIDISSTELRLNDNLTTSGAILLDAAVRLQDSVTLKSTGNGDIHFKKTVDGAFDLAVETAGVTRFDGQAGSLSALKSVTTDSPGSTTLAANMTTLDSISFNDSVRLTNNVILVSQSGATVAFAKQIDGAFHLAVNTTGMTSLGGVVGGATALSSLTTNSGGTTKINSDITTTGAIQFNDAIELTSNVTLSSMAAGDIGFATTVNGPGALVVNTSGVTTFSGVVGGTTALASLKTDDAGTTYLNADLTVAGALQLQDAVILTIDATLKSTGGDQITFGKTVDGAYSLNVNTAGITRFNGKVGATTGLASVTTDAPGTTSINADLTTAGQMQFNDSVLLTNHVLFTSTNQGDIRFDKTVDGAFGLTAVTSGVTRFNGNVGGTTALAFLTTDAPGETQLNANLKTSGHQTIRDELTLLKSVTMETTANGNILLGSPVDTQGNDFILSAGGSGDVTVLDDISGGGHLTVKQGTDISFGPISVDSLTIEKATTSVTFIGAVVTTGSVSVNSSGTIDQQSTVQSDAGIQYAATGVISIQNSMTAANDIVIESKSASAKVSSTAPIDAGNDLRIAAATTISSESKLTAGHAVDLKSVGTTTLSTASNIDAGIGGVSIKASKLITGAIITTADGDVIIDGPTQLTNHIEINTKSAGDITVTGSINGTSDLAQNLKLLAGAGNVKVTGDIGNSIRLGEVIIQSANDVDFDGSLSSLFFQQLQGTGVTTFHGAVNTFGTIGGTGDGFQFTGESLRFEPGSSSLDTHGKDVTLTADAITLPTTFVRATNSTVTIQTLSAATSIGLGDATQTLNFTDSQLDVIDSDNIVIGSDTQTAGIKIGTDGPITQSENYELRTVGNITVNGLFQLDTNHELTANVGTDLQINANGKLATSSGLINLEVGRDTRILGRIETASGSITVDSVRNTSLGPAARIETASGDIEITTGATISGTGFLMMANGSLIDGGTGRVSLTAEQDVTLSQVKTTNGTDQAIRITSHSGGIRNGSLVADNLIDETIGARVTLRSATGIGSNSGLGIDSSVVTRVSSIDLLNTTSGDIRVHEKSGLLIHRIDQQGPGMIDVHVDGTSTVLATGSGIKAREGNVLLSADGPASDLLVRAPISTTGGDITLRAGHDVRIDATGPINSNNGDVQIIADSGLLKNGIGGQVLMQDGATIRAGTGTVLLQADQDLTVGQIETFNATSNALRLVSTSGSLVNGGNSVGDNLIANAAGALTTIQTHVGVGAIQPLSVDLDRLHLTNGSAILPLSGVDTRIQLSEHNSVIAERLVQHNAGNVKVVAEQDLTVGQISAITSPNSFISLESKSGAIVTGGNSLIPNVAAQTLVMRASTGIGSESPLVTRIVNLAATNSVSGNLQVANVLGAVLNIGSIDGIHGLSHTGAIAGNISVSNTAPINVAFAVHNASGGSVTLNALGVLSSITVTAPVMATGSNGNISLIAGQNINLFDTGLNADIQAEGTGVITIQSGNLVNFFPNVIVQSGTGSITNAPPRFVNLLTPQITAGGIATVTGDFGRPGEHNFTITVNWNDGTFTTEVFENPGSFIFTHFYNENPNPTNPAAPIPIDVTVVADLQIHVFGRNTTTNNALGSLDFTTLRSFAPVPGEGFGAFAFDLTPSVKLLHFPEPQPVGDLQQGSAQTPTVALVIEPIPEKDDLGPSAKRKVFFQIGKRNADGTGWEYDEGIELTEDFLEQIFDPELIEQIPDGRYRVQLQEPGETIKRLVIEFEIVNGTIADGTGPMREDLVPESPRTEKTPVPTTSPPEGTPADALDPENEVPVLQQIEESQLVPPPALKPQQTDLASEPQIRPFDSANSHMNKNYESFASNSGRRLWQKAVCELEQRADSVDDSTVHRDAIPRQETSEFDRTSEFTPLESSVVLVGLASTIAGVGRSTIPNHRAGARNTGPLPMSRAARLMRKFTTRREGAQ